VIDVSGVGLRGAGGGCTPCFFIFLGGSGFWGCFRVPFFVLWVFLGYFVSRLLLNSTFIATE